MLIAYALVSIPIGALLGLMEVGLFYHPGRNTGPTRRIYHLMFSATLLLIGGMFAATALGIYTQSDSPPDQQRAIGTGLFLGYVLGGGWLGIRRRRRGRALEAAREQIAATTAARVETSVARAAARTVVRTGDYFIGATFCMVALIAGAAVGHSTESWLSEQGIESALALFVLVHAATFVYSQLVTGRALKAFNTAVRTDWRIRRCGQYLLAAGPLLLALPLAVLSVGTAAGIVLQLIALAVGYRKTHEPPAGTLTTLRRVRATASAGSG